MILEFFVQAIAFQGLLSGGGKLFLKLFKLIRNLLSTDEIIWL